MKMCGSKVEFIYETVLSNKVQKGSSVFTGGRRRGAANVQHYLKRHSLLLSTLIPNVETTKQIASMLPHALAENYKIVRLSKGRPPNCHLRLIGVENSFASGRAVLRRSFAL